MPMDERYVVGPAGTAASLPFPPAGLVGAAPDALLDWGKWDGLDVRCATVRGTSHRTAREARQDAFAVGSAESADTSWLVAAVSDGVGSMPKSHVASAIVSAVSVELVSLALAEGTAPLDVDWEGLLTHLSEVLKSQPDADQMAATLAVLMVGAAGDDGVRPVVAVKRGDTSVLILGAEGWRLSGQAPGLDGATSALPSSRPTYEVEQGELSPGEVVVVFTDGIGNALMDGHTELGERLKADWATAPSIYEFGSQVDYVRQTHQDDRTAVAVWSPSPTA